MKFKKIETEITKGGFPQLTGISFNKTEVGILIGILEKRKSQIDRYIKHSILARQLGD